MPASILKNCRIAAVCKKVKNNLSVEYCCLDETKKKNDILEYKPQSYIWIEKNSARYNKYNPDGRNISLYGVTLGLQVWEAQQH